MTDIRTPTRRMAVYPCTTAGLIQALADLGDTSDQIAATLRDHGCRGKKRCDTTCPIANYLARLFPGHDAYILGDTPDASLVAELWPHGATRPDVTAPLPAAAKRFVARFDTGEAFIDLAWPDEEAA